MRLYKFLSAEHGLENIERRRVKLSRIDTLNDEFEFLSLKLGTADRKALLNARSHMHGTYGLHCMSATWSSPVMWAHYACNGKGLCLGFEVTEDAWFQPIEYRRRLLQFADLGIANCDDLTGPSMMKVMRTKGAGWKYETEWRAFRPLKEALVDGDLHFERFGPDLILREVIVGAHSKTSRQTVLDKIGDLENVQIIRAMRAFTTFRMVPNGDAGRWP